MPDWNKPDCQKVDQLVTPYVDGQLDDRERAAVAEHLTVCPPCDWRVRKERAVRDLVGVHRVTLSAESAPGALRARCAESMRRAADLDRPAPVTPAGWRGRLAPLALAASLVLIVGAAFLYQLTQASSRIMAAELTADHVKCFTVPGAGHPDSGAVESSLWSGFGWRVHLPARVTQANLELVDARPCFYAEGRVAHVMFRHNGQPVSLFMLPNTERAQEVVKVLGHEAAIWCDNRRTFVLIAREPKADVERLASMVQATLR